MEISQNDDKYNCNFSRFADGSMKVVFRNPENINGLTIEIKDGKYNGYGKLFFTDGSWFEGIFIDNKPYKGMRFSTDGKISEYQEGKQL